MQYDLYHQIKEHHTAKQHQYEGAPPLRQQAHVIKLKDLSDNSSLIKKR